MKLKYPTEAELHAIREEAMRFSSIGIYRYTFEGKIIFLDRGALQLLDLEDHFTDPLDLVGKDIGSLFSRIEEQPRLRDITKKRGHVRNLEYGYRTLKGDERWVYHSSYIVRDTSTGEDVIQVIARDITELKRTARALAASEQRFRTLAEGKSHGLAVIQGNPATIVFANQVLEQLLATEHQSLVGRTAKSLLHLVHPQDRRHLVENFLNLLNGGSGGAVFDIRLRTNSGATRWVTTNLASVDYGDSPAIQVLILDATERKLQETRQRTLERRLQNGQKLESLGILAGGIAHDFNNLLSTILAYADLANLQTNPSSSVKEGLDAIVDASIRGAGLCRQLLNYAGRGELSTESLCLNEMVDEMDRLIDVSVQKRIKVTFDLEPDLPWIHGDRSQLSQVLMNMITNSAESIGRGVGHIMIRTGTKDFARKDLDRFHMGTRLNEGPHVFVDVHDDGRGMNAQTLAKIFDPFFTTKSTGRGLGLAAVLGIVKRHHGAIKVTSTVDEGTQFRLLLPISDQRGEDDHLKQETNRQTLGGFALVVDDEAGNRDSISRMLAHLGYAVFTAQNGREAIRIMHDERNTISLLVLDVVLPDLDGFQVFEEVRTIDSNVPILFISGFDEGSYAATLAQLNNVAFLAKPFGLSKLDEKLQAFLGSQTPLSMAPPLSPDESW